MGRERRARVSTRRLNVAEDSRRRRPSVSPLSLPLAPGMDKYLERRMLMTYKKVSSQGATKIQRITLRVYVGIFQRPHIVFGILSINSNVLHFPYRFMNSALLPGFVAGAHTSLCSETRSILTQLRYTFGCIYSTLCGNTVQFRRLSGISTAYLRAIFEQLSSGNSSRRAR